MIINLSYPFALNIHTSYFSHAVNYSHEYVTFWHVWNIRTTNFDILIGTSFSQMCNFRPVKNSHVFVTPVKNSKFSHVWQVRANFSHLWQIRSNVKVKRICHKCEKIDRICHTCEEFVRTFHRCEGLTRNVHICTQAMCDKFIKRVFVMHSYLWPLISLSITLYCEKKNVEETSGCS